jgi:hypothetical protein
VRGKKEAMQHTRIRQTRGIETYRVWGDFKGLTDEEIAHKIDPWNFGFDVKSRSADELIIDIYID